MQARHLPTSNRRLPSAEHPAGMPPRFLTVDCRFAALFELWLYRVGTELADFLDASSVPPIASAHISAASTI
jgi:hypothetical protein